MFRFVLLFSVFLVNNGFLLDNNPPTNQTLGNTKIYMTIDDRNKIHQDIDTLRAEQTQALNILTAQVKQKLNDLDQKIQSTSNENATCEQVLLENIQLKNKVLDIQNAYTKLENKTRSLESKLSMTENRTIGLENELRDLRQLKTVQNLQNVKTMETNVQTLTAKVNDLASHEQARNEDFLALFNSTTYSFKAIQAQEVKLNHSLQATETFLNQSLTQTLAKLKNSIFNNMTILRQEVQTMNNNTKNELNAIKDRKVARAKGNTYNDNEIIKFSDFKTSIGLTDRAAFTSSGKFTCTFPGLYLISFTLMSNTDDAYLVVYKNNDLLNGLYIGPLTFSSSEVTGVFVLELQAGDTVYVKCGKEQLVYSQSMITIVKID